MERFILVEMIFAFIILLNVNLESLVQGHLLIPAETFSFKIRFHEINSNFNPDVDFENNNNFFTNYNDEASEIDSISINEKNNNLKQIAIKLKKFKDYSDMLSEKNPSSAVKKIVKPKIYDPLQKKLQMHLTETKNKEDKITVSEGTRQLEVNSEDIPFVPTWPKYTENSMQYILPLQKLTESKQTRVAQANFASLINEHEPYIEKTVKSDLVNTNLKREPKSIKINPKEIVLGPKVHFITKSITPSLPEGNEVHEKLKMTANEPSSQTNNIIMPKQFESQKLREKLAPQMFNYEYEDEADDAEKRSFEINNTHKSNDNSAQSEDHDQRTEESSENSFFPAFESKLEDVPWNLYKDEGFPNVKPFPELHNLGNIRRKNFQESSEIPKVDLFKKALPFNAEERIREIGGPVLYPKPSFIKEFHVPFFV